MPFRHPTQSPMTPAQSLRLLLSHLRSEQAEARLGGDLRGPAASDGYAQLVSDALRYAWTWRGNEKT